ncbi:MAG: sigma-70 family RNA polymerase sigma factor [Gammaproteobacteria bacterium]|nr:sigma-70 family RNA polymerase sigma factor [Gammaproteobacteria bacterium]
MSAHSQRLTNLLAEARSGKPGADDAVYETVYADLERIAARHLRERYGFDLAGATLEPAALVNESYLKLLGQRQEFRNRNQFFAIATRVMLRVLGDYERSKGRIKRGGNQVRVTLAGNHEALLQGNRSGIDSFSDALDELRGNDEQAANIVALRLLWGLSMTEVADALGISLRTTERRWRFARAWLADALGA